MALVKCVECGTEVSDKAPACPKCGAPQATVAAAPPAVKTPRKTSPVTWAVFFALIGGIFWYSLQSKHEASLPPLPVAVNYRPALIGQGLVFMFENKSDGPVSFVATLQHPALNTEKRVEVYVPARGTTKLGSSDGWIGQTGDRITLANANFQTWSGSIP
jgi:hypothetical protein